MDSFCESTSRCSVVLTAVHTDHLLPSHTRQPHQVEILDHIHVISYKWLLVATVTQKSLWICIKHQ